MQKRLQSENHDRDNRDFFQDSAHKTGQSVSAARVRVAGPLGQNGSSHSSSASIADSEAAKRRSRGSAGAKFKFRYLCQCDPDARAEFKFKFSVPSQFSRCDLDGSEYSNLNERRNGTSESVCSPPPDSLSLRCSSWCQNRSLIFKGACN